MARNRFDRYDDERLLPYWVRLGRIDGATYGGAQDPMQTLLHLDLRGGQFTRDASYRLEKVFQWLTSGFQVNKYQMDEHCLIITPLDPQRDFEVVDGLEGQVTY